MREFFREIVHALEEGRPVELVSIAASDGSTPRGAGAMMAVFPGGGITGTIGGGNVEFECQSLAAELLEIFQWSGADLECRDKLGRIREELADVLSYCVLMADVCGLDLDEILNAKVDQNAAKYPVEKARGSAAKYTELT